MRTIATHTLQKNVRHILKASGFTQILRIAQIQLTGISEPKQTTTTQRWKVHLRSEFSRNDLPTRIEFSRRKFDPGIVFGQVDNELVTAYNLRPIFASHYDVETAFSQKVEALIGRKETQARDAFDLSFLLQRGATGSAMKLDRKRLTKAVETVMSVSYGHFLSQVVAYLMPEYQESYNHPKAWEAIQENVIARLEAL